MQNESRVQLLNVRNGQAVNLNAYLESVQSDNLARQNAQQFGLLPENAQPENVPALVGSELSNWLNRPVQSGGGVPDGILIRVLECAEGEEANAIFLRAFRGTRQNGSEYNAVAALVRFNILNEDGSESGRNIDISLTSLCWENERLLDASGQQHQYAEGHIGENLQGLTLQEAVKWLQGRVLRTHVETYARPQRRNATRLVSLVEEAPASAPATTTTRGRGRRS